MKYKIFLALLLFAPLFVPSDVTLPVCSVAVHDTYKATGPDGAQYATWHPIVDSKNACHFDHEHGSNPASFGVPAGKSAPMPPLFGYAAKDMPEGHAGFKVYVFEVGGKRWQVLHHFGTGNAALAACNKHHTLDMRALDLATNTLLIDVHAMGDYGRSVNQQTPAVPLTPAACPNQAVGWIAGTNGQRIIPIADQSPIGYEPWSGAHAYNVFGSTTAAFTVNTTDPQSACDYITCTANVDLGTNIGGFRFLTWTRLGWASGANTGTFCTNAHGIAVLACSDSAALQQYVAPALNFTINNPTPGCRPWGRLEYDYLCGVAGDNELYYKVNPFVTGVN